MEKQQYNVYRDYSGTQSSTVQLSVSDTHLSQRRKKVSQYLCFQTAIQIFVLAILFIEKCQTFYITFFFFQTFVYTF